MSELRKYLENFAGPEFFGGVVEMFVLKHGKSYEQAPLPEHPKLGQPGYCFYNATRAAWDGHGRYVEGFGYKNGLIPIQHAWLEVDGKAVDLTWTNDVKFGDGTIEYFGVPFETKVLRRETFKNGFYGMLDTGSGINLELMEQIDPEFVAMIKKRSQERFADAVKA